METKEFRNVISIEEAEKRLYTYFKPSPKVEEVALEEALGRILGEDVVASLDVPPFDRASMDGYAVIASDTFYASEDKPVELELSGVIQAGESKEIVIKKGECIRIATGAPIPHGTDAVVMVEYTNSSGDGVKVYSPVSPGEHIMRAGADIKQGTKVLEKGTVLSPRETGVLAALGINNVRVFKKPRVGIISTGSELVEPGKPLPSGKIYDVNARAISDAVRVNGCIAEFLDIARDEKTLTRTIKESNYDVIITTGGTSVGAEDITYKVVEKLGRLIAHGLAVKPGKPTMLGIIDGRPLVGLPGYPTSALIIFSILVAPMLRKMAGLPNKEPKKASAKLASRVYSAKGRFEYLPVKLDGEKVHPILKGSGAITSLAGAHGYVEIPRNVEILEEGSKVEVILFT
ncbi:MAG: gephyrin-like molybdotransferase Glp [Candidatus Hydrothermarchaeales archaeon]